MFSKGNTALDYILFVLQLGFFAFFIFEISSVDIFIKDALKYIGSIPMVIGAIIIIWALINLGRNLSVLASPKEGSKLITKGIYKSIRHPIYAGLIFIAFGYSIYLWSPYKLIAAFLIFLFFEIKTSYEEKKLIEQFGDYEEYKLKTGKFFPFQINLGKSRLKNPELEIVKGPDKNRGNKSS